MKAEKEKPRDIRERSFEYALRAIKLYQSLLEEKSGAGRILGRQFLKAATSIGANIEEAQAGESRADFIHKYGIAQKESKECLYWLRLLVRSQIISDNRLKSLMQETEELISIITTIIVNKGRNKHNFSL